MSVSLQVLENLVVKYKSEIDPKRKNIAYLNLVQESLKLVKEAVSGIYPLPASTSRDDLIQVGALGILKAIDLYASKEHGSFKTYANKFIKGRILQYLRDKANIVKPPRDCNENESQNIKNIVSLDQNVFSIEGQETLLDRVQDKNYEQDFENKKVIEFALNKLVKQEKDVIYKYYIEDMKKKDIAQVMGISAMQVSRLIKRALKKMYLLIEKDLKE